MVWPLITTLEEFNFPRSRVFRILFISVVITTLLYVFIMLLSVTAYPPEYRSWMEYIKDLGNLDGIKGLPAFYAAWIHMGDTGVTLLIAALSILIPLLGRTAIGWIVDVTTIGATIIYGFVAAASYKVAKHCGDKPDKIMGITGLVLMIGVGLVLMLPNLFSAGTMERETYFLFTVWEILGFIYFRYIFSKDKKNRFGRSTIVWIGLLMFILFTTMVWLSQSTVNTGKETMNNVGSYYKTEYNIKVSDKEEAEFMEKEMDELRRSNMNIRKACSLICESFSHSPVYRVGGDEFFVVITGRDYEERMEIISEINRCVEDGLNGEGVVISIGVSEYDRDKDENLREVIERADALMYIRKKDLKTRGARVRV